MKKRSMNPKHAEFFSTLIVASLFVTIVMAIAGTIFKHTLSQAENQYYDSLYAALDGYMQTTEQINQQYINSINAFFIPGFTEKASAQQIFDFLCTYDLKKNPDFYLMYYIDKTGTMYFSNGNLIQMLPDKHPILYDDSTISFSNIYYAERSNQYVIGIEQAVYDEQGNKKGALCASVSVDSFNKKLESIKIGQNLDFFIVDSKGQFVYTKNKNLIGKIYTPEQEEYKKYSSDYLAQTNEYFLPSIPINGKEYDLLLKKQPLTGTTLVLSVPHEAIESLYTEQKRTKRFAFGFCVIIILVLTFIEMKIMEALKRKQLITNQYDSLTNLWTRQYFEQEATKLLRANPKTKFMLVEADIRGFKFINETYGEEAADKLIVYYSKVINHFSTKFHGIIGRGFADRLYVLFKVTSVQKAMGEFKTNMVECEQMTAKSEIPFFPKFGIAFLLPDNKKRDITIQGLIGQASFAKSTIKDDALTTYSVYNSRLLDKINEEHYIEGKMQQALDDGEFFVMYQPKISLKDEKICGAEALVRWNNPEQGFMTPDRFIPLFERNGFIKKLDFYVYEQVFKLLEKQLAAGEPVVPISVNMSRNHNKAEKFIHDFLELFHKYNVPPEYVQLEIIERSFMGSNTLSEITERLHKEGFSVAMDDFGSGESSLNMLTTIPVDVLKFDRVFLLSSMNEDGTMDPKSAEFIHILINLSKNLEKQSVFEGVETQEQCDFLKSINCDVIQGYFYSKPLAEQDFLEFVKMHL